MYALFVVVLSGFLLLINAVVCTAVYAALPIPSNNEIAPRIGQFFFYLGPIILMVIQWNLLDRLARLFRN